MKSLRTLYSQLALALVVLLLIVGLLFTWLSKTLFEQSFLSGYQQFNRSLAADLVREMDLVSNGRVDRNAMREAFEMMVLVNPGIEAYFLDVKGDVVDHTGVASQAKLAAVDLSPIRQFFAGDSMYPLKGTDPRNAAHTKPFSVAVLPTADDPQGYLYIVLQNARFDEFQLQAQSSAIHTLGIWALSGSLAIGLILGLVLFNRLTRRIRLLIAAFDSFRESGFKKLQCDLVINDKNNDEISCLVRRFEQMAEHIIEQYSSLQQQDKLRRDMIANVTHDLRTPLASLHGYVERLRDHFDEAEPEDRKRYLDVCVRQSTRLTRLIDDLFELSALEARESKPQLEPFLLPELVRDVVQKFRLRADDRNIRLRLVQGQSLPMVNGDIALLDRALSNLVDNALDHTPPGGEVALIIGNAGDCLSVTLKDTGCGISEQDLQVIFKRYHRRGPRSHGSRQHAGLGLAITHRILELHGQAIRVSSKEDRGTTFQFCIPVYR